MKITGIILEHGKNDFTSWFDFGISEEDTKTIMGILKKYRSGGCSTRGNWREIFDFDSGNFQDGTESKW